MEARLNRRQVLRLGAGAGALTLLAACDTLNFGDTSTSAGIAGAANPARPAAGGTFGTGATKVALLLPLSGDAAVAGVGISMANAAQLAMEYVAANPKIGDNITLQVLDTGGTAQGATAQANAAVAAGSALILGPLKAEEVQAAGSVAKAAHIPLIGFSNNSSVAAPGIYLLNVLPESEINRSLTYALAHGRKSIAAVFPSTDFGDAQRAAFEQVASRLGATIHGTYTFGSDSEMRTMVSQLAPILKAGDIDMIFLPERASAPAIAGLLQRAGVQRGRQLIVGSADWDDDQSILSTGYLTGAVYPAVDDTGYRALQGEYTARFGGSPHPLATIAYTATILANAAPLVKSHYSDSQLTVAGGFNGRDGVFRFLPDGRSQYALIMKQISAGTAVRVDGPKL